MEDNRKILRGDVYWVRTDNGVGYEMAQGKRPAVVVGSQKGLDTSSVVQIVFLSSQSKRLSIVVPVSGLDRKWSNAHCNQIFTVDKSRLMHYSHTLSVEEMDKIDYALCDALDLHSDRQTRKELDAFRELSDSLLNEVAELKRSKSDVSELKFELEMYKRLYEKAMDKVVELKIEADFKPKIPYVAEPKVAIIEDLRKLKDKSPFVDEELEITEEVDVEPKVVCLTEHEPVVVEEEAESEIIEKVDLNTATASQLQKLGMSNGARCRIIAFRKEYGRFNSLDDLLLIDGIGKNFIDKFRDKLTLGYPVLEPEVEEPIVKVNLNTATGRELINIGMSNGTSYRIVGYRKENGGFSSVDDLLLIPGVGEGVVDRFRDKLMVGDYVPEVVAPVEEEPIVKVNLNTATRADFLAAGISEKYSWLIRKHREEHGNYNSVDDLLNVDVIGKNFVEKNRHKFFVDPVVGVSEEPKFTLEKQPKKKYKKKAKASVPKKSC